jgi:peptidyl-prolyl cis-trans isomerase D
MLSLMRKHAQSWLIKITLFIVAIVFVFWGVGSFKSDPTAKVASVNGKTITQNEYQQAYHQYLQMLQGSGGGRLDEKALQELKVKKKVLDLLIQKRIMADLGKELGFSAGPEELARKIQQIPAFQQNGKFSPSRYRQLLQMNRVTPEEFEAEQSSALLEERLRAFISEFVKIEPEEVRNFFHYLSDEINLQLVRFSQTNFEKKIASNPDQVKAFFAKNSTRYQNPAEVRVRYLEIDPQAFEGSVEVPEKELQGYYQQNQAKFLDPKKNQPLPLEEVREKIRETIQRDKAREIARQKAEDLYDQLLLSGDLKAFGSKVKAAVQETGWLIQGKPGADLEGEKAFYDQALALKKGGISSVLDLGPQRGFFILQSVERKETQPMTFAQAAFRVEQDWRSAQASLLAQSEAEKFLKEARQHKDWTALAREKNLTVEETGFFSRFKNLPSWANTQENFQAASALSADHPLPDKPIKVGADQLVIGFKTYRAASPEDFDQQKDRFTTVLRQQKNSRLLEDWTKALQRKAKIKLYQEFN